MLSSRIVTPQTSLMLSRARLGEVLRSRNAVSDDDMAEALRRQQARPGSRLGAVLLDMELVTDQDVAQALAVVHELEFVDVDRLVIDRTLARLVPRGQAERVGILVHGRHDGQLCVVVTDPVDVVTLDDVRMITGAVGLDVTIGSRSAVLRALSLVWAERDDEDAFRAFVDETTPIDVDERPDIEDAATVRLVDRLLALAVRERASDIHIEPHRDGVTVRLRVDGVLLEVLELPRSGYSAVTARLKIISGLDVMERRLPQDGRTRIPVDGAVLDARVSTLPCLNGENLVIRLLPAATRLPSLEDLGLEPEHRASLLRAVGAAQGLVLITGPTGSGKTNTLYALLSDGIGRTRNVITLEDPVEIELAGLTQVQIDERSGLSFARVLRSALRQDPDVILVGEIRDQETAELAVRASLTGHLVLSTLHTMDACAAVTRLADMGVPAYLIGSSLRLVASQRLVRVPCVECAEADPHAAAALESLRVPASEGSWVRAVGCPACNDTGYRGRTALVEVIPFEESLRTQLLTGSSEADLRAAARRCGASSLLEAGLRAASQSRTTLAEVQRVCPDP